MRGRVEMGPTAVLAFFNAAAEVQQDGSDEIGYRLRLRSSAGTPTPHRNAVYYVQRRNGQYLLAAMSNAPDMIASAALRLANESKLEAARTWLNWAREAIA